MLPMVAAAWPGDALHRNRIGGFQVTRFSALVAETGWFSAVCKRSSRPLKLREQVCGNYLLAPVGQGFVPPVTTRKRPKLMKQKEDRPSQSRTDEQCQSNPPELALQMKAKV
jgi:hypothetical protein